MDIRRKEHEVLNPLQFLEIYSFVKEIPWLEKLLTEYIELHNFCTSTDELAFINDLIKKFKYVSYSELSSHVQNLVNFTLSIPDLISSNTMIYSFADKSKPDGSHIIIQMMKNKFPIQDKWGEYNFSTNITDINQQKGNIKNIILVDDYIGTGNTAHRKIKYVRKVLERKNITDVKVFILSIAAMKFAKPKLDAMSIQYHSDIWLEKGISETLNPDKIEDAKSLMILLESRLKKEYNNKRIPSLGYEESEALFSIEDLNVPNNVFPIFWWPFLKNGDQRNTMFRRSN